MFRVGVGLSMAEMRIWLRTFHTGTKGERETLFVMFTALLYSGCRVFSSYSPFFRRISQRNSLFIAKNPLVSDIDSPPEAFLGGGGSHLHSEKSE